MKKTLIIGSVHADLIAHVASLPKGNEEFTADRTDTAVSGSGWKAANTFEKFGIPYTLIAPAGTGVYADFVDNEAEKAGIKLNCRSSETSGCTYHLIDRKGNESFFLVPGAEYEFSIDYIQEIDPDDTECTVLFGDMLSGDTPEDVIATAEELDCPLYFAPREAAGVLDDVLLEAVEALHPVLHVTDTEAYYLLGEKKLNLKETAKALYARCKSPVMILSKGEGCYYYDGEEDFLAPEQKPADPDLHLSMFVICSRAGVDVRNSLMNANRFASEYISKLPTEREMEYEKRKLVGLITLK